MRKWAGHKRGGDIQRHDSLLICDRSGFAINSRDAVADGRYPNEIVHKDYYCPPDMFEYQVTPPTENVPDPSRPDRINFMPLFCYVNGEGNVFCINKIIPGTAATAQQVSDATPTVTPATFSISRFAPIGTTIGTVAVTIPNGDPLEISITAGNTNDDLSISSSTGVLTVANTLNINTTPSYTLTVQGANVAPGSNLTGTAAILVNVNGSFNPADFGPVLTWVDGQNSGNFTLSGNAVTNITDSSGNGYNYSQSSGSYRPIYTSTGFNNLDGMTFDYTDPDHVISDKTATDWVITNGNNTEFTIVFVCKIISQATSVGRILFDTTDFGGGNGQGTYILHNGTANIIAAVTRNGSGQNVASIQTTLNPGTGTNYIIAYTFKYSDTVRGRLYINGTELANSTGNQSGTPASSGSSSKTAYIGSSGGFPTNSQYGFRGAIGEFFFIEEKLSAADITTMTAELQAKWNL